MHKLTPLLQAGSEYKQWTELRYLHKFWGGIAIHGVHAFGFYLCMHIRLISRVETIRRARTRYIVSVFTVEKYYYTMTIASLYIARDPPLGYSL
jgi:hypothetical protein